MPLPPTQFLFTPPQRRCCAPCPFCYCGSWDEIYSVSGETFGAASKSGGASFCDCSLGTIDCNNDGTLSMSYLGNGSGGSFNLLRNDGTLYTIAFPGKWCRWGGGAVGSPANCLARSSSLNIWIYESGVSGGLRAVAQHTSGSQLGGLDFCAGISAGDVALDWKVSDKCLDREINIALSNRNDDNSHCKAAANATFTFAL